jgi:DNA-binding transcriptional ArsR family regulator
MPNYPCGAYFSEEILRGLIAKIGLPAYAVLSVIAAAESRDQAPVRMPLEKIAELMGKSVETIRSALHILKKHDLVAVELQGRNNVYWVLRLPGVHLTQEKRSSG